MATTATAQTPSTRSGKASPEVEPPGKRSPGGARNKRGGPLRRMWRTTLGKKSVMAVSGLLMLGYLVVHMLGNLKIFFGSDDFNGYAHWLRTIGEPFLHHEWFLWIARVVLLAAVVAHAVSAYQLSRRDLAARPVKYVHRRARTSYATRTMRWGGVIMALFLVWHILDLTTGTVNPNGESGQAYQNVVATFSTWYGNTIYVIAMLAVGLHVQHGFYGAAQTLGVTRPGLRRGLSVLSHVLAVVLTAGFLSVPIAVMTGAVH